MVFFFTGHMGYSWRLEDKAQTSGWQVATDSQMAQRLLVLDKWTVASPAHIWLGVVAMLKQEAFSAGHILH